MDDSTLEDNKFWGRTFFHDRRARPTLDRRKRDLTAPQNAPLTSHASSRGCIVIKIPAIG
jgi:hypothetical protein